MKNLFIPVCFLAAVGCTTLTREPAAIGKNEFNFELYGANPIPNSDFKFELLNLKALPGKIEFSTHQLYDRQSEGDVQAWQEELGRFFRDNKEGLRFEKNKLIVDIDGDVLKDLNGFLAAVDRTEANANLRLRKKLEGISAFNEHFKDPDDYRIDILFLPFRALEQLASHLIAVRDGGTVQRAPSSFWSPHGKTDMWMGPGQVDFEKVGQEICTYHGPKKGFGVNAGFKIKCLDEKLKVKFGREVHSGPLNSRIYHRLGYNVPAIHFLPELKVAYDRRLFAEFNSRKPKHVRIRMGGKEVAGKDFDRVYDAFEYVKFAVLKDGSKISSSEFKKQLVKSCPGKPCDFSDSNVDATFESKISHLIFDKSSITESIGDEVGPWNYSSLDHPNRTEIKSLLLVGAWTGNFDLRKDNTSLVWDKSTKQMKHFISDPGSGLGSATNFAPSEGNISQMTWSATMETRVMDMDTQVPMVGLTKYKEFGQNDAFNNLTYSEAQWMVRQIASISEQDLSEALAASGLSSAEFLLAREKLVSIQQKMIEHFGLKAEFGPQFRRINTQLNFDPNTQSMEVRFQNGRVVKLENRGVRLANGSLIFPSQSK